MRDQKTWETQVRSEVIKKLFTPRLQEILQNNPSPKFEPELESLFLYGTTQFGKTVYSAFMVLELRRRMFLDSSLFENTNREIIFMPAQDIFSSIKQTFDHPQIPPSEYDLIKKYSEALMLVIDDLGTVNPTTYVLQTLYGIINTRYEYKRLTVITSNYDLAQLGKELGDVRIISRIGQMCQVKEKLDYKKIAK